MNPMPRLNYLERRSLSQIAPSLDVMVKTGLLRMCQMGTLVFISMPLSQIIGFLFSDLWFSFCNIKGHVVPIDHERHRRSQVSSYRIYGSGFVILRVRLHQLIMNVIGLVNYFHVLHHLMDMNPSVYLLNFYDIKTTRVKKLGCIFPPGEGQSSLSTTHE